MKDWWRQNILVDVYLLTEALDTTKNKTTWRKRYSNMCREYPKDIYVKYFNKVLRESVKKLYA